MPVQYDPSSRPHIQANHIDGPLLFALAVAGYLAACAGSERWLTFREWWGD